MLNYLDNIYLSIKKAYFDFKLPFIVIVILYLLWIYSVYVDNLSPFLGKTILSLYLLLFLLIAIYIYCKNSKYKVYTIILSFVFTLFFFYFLPVDLKYLSWIWNLYLSFIFISAFILLFLAGYNKDENKYYNYVYNLILWILKTIIVSLLLFVLWMFVLFAIDKLFKFGFDKLYWYWLVFVYVLFSGFYFLSTFNDINIERKKYGKLEMYLIKYILLPFILIYFFVIFIYTLKLLFTWKLPNWIVVYMVLFFSIFTYFTYIFIKKIKEFDKVNYYLPLLVLFSLPVFFYAIYVRISNYWITADRYLVLAIGIYLLLISLYYFFSKRKHLVYLFWWILLLFFIISVWPWSLGNYTEKKQLYWIYNILEKNKCLDNNNYKIACKLKKSEKIKLANKISYVCKEYGCNKLYMFKNQLNEIKKNKLKELENKFENTKDVKLKKDIKKQMEDLSNWYFNNYELKNKLLSKLNLSEYSYNIYGWYIYVRSKLSNLINTFGYSYLIKPSYYDDLNFQHDAYYVNIYNNNLYLYEDKKLVWKVNIDNKIFIEKYKNEWKNLNSNISIIYNIWVYEVKLVVTDYTLKNNNLESINQAFVLIKRVR